MKLPKNMEVLIQENLIFDLNDLVRLIGPKDTTLPSEHTEFSSQGCIMDRRADRIAKYIYVSGKGK